MGQTPSIPRKGTETQVGEESREGAEKSDTLNSPQGDGNPWPHLRDGRPRTRQTPSIPRKGTET